LSFVSAASATNDPNKRITSKQYAQGQLTNELYKCLSVLYGKESAWNWKAVGNLKMVYYDQVDPYNIEQLTGFLETVNAVCG
jgi:hypothetical protein